MLLEDRISAARRGTEPCVSTQGYDGAAESEEVSESRLLAWALERMGIGCEVVVGGKKSVALGAGGGRAEYAIHLVQSVPVKLLLEALTDLQGRKGATAVLM